MEEEKLNPPLHFKRTLIRITTSSKRTIYPPIIKDWYRESIEQPHIQEIDWKTLDVSYNSKEPRLIKIVSQLISKEMSHYKSLIMEYRDNFAWSYIDLKKIHLKVAQSKILLLLDSILKRQKEHQMNLVLQLIVKAKLEKLLQVSFIKSIEIIDWIIFYGISEKKWKALRFTFYWWL